MNSPGGRRPLGILVMRKCHGGVSSWRPRLMWMCVLVLQYVRVTIGSCYSESALRRGTALGVVL